MTSRPAALAHYLRSRRDQLDPASFGYVSAGRRVPGLRRDELARPAGISEAYYTRLEQGRGHQMSEQVLRNLAGALRLDDAERAYFYRLALPEVSSRPTESGPQAVSAFAAVKQFPDNEEFQEIARGTVAALRFHGNPGNPRLQQIVVQLAATVARSRRLCAGHDARPLTQGIVPISIEGRELVDFPWQILEVPGGFFMTFWPVRPGTRARSPGAPLVPDRAVRAQRAGAEGARSPHTSIAPPRSARCRRRVRVGSSVCRAR